ncbi:MAG: four helix bundle protein [Leptolyngbyaceae cyanobacterium CSU_1_3]|nr:four helix bundle protein [Leptolyngbyaceae cyanobacterium CSU_1_3]
MTRRLIRRYHELQVYEVGFEMAMHVLEVSRELPPEEEALRGQMVRAASQRPQGSSRLVCANIAEAWQRRRYEGAFAGRFLHQSNLMQLPHLYRELSDQFRQWI